MISMIKSAVKTAFIQRKIEEYNAGLDAEFVSYDSWMKEREAVPAVASANAAIIEYKDCVKEFTCPIDSDFVIFVNKKENLAENAVSVIADYFAVHPESALVYGDEDEWNSNQTVRMNPWFKPDFSPDTLLSYFYYGNIFAVRTDALQDVIWMASDDYLMNLYDMCLQLSFPVKREAVGHAQYVLYHADNLRQLCVEAAYETLRTCYRKRNSIDSVMDCDDKISVVIPSKDHPGTLSVCLQSLINTGKNENYEIVVVDNGSSPDAKKKYEDLKNKFRFNYIYEPMDFNFSHMCNLGAKAATGKYILFLNDDIEAKDEGWMSKMRAHVAKKHVGAVGAKLYYPDSKTIQHAGITNLRLGPVHKMQFLEDERPYYDGRNQYDLDVIAVTAACLMVRKDIFMECGGFSEELAVAFNDVELCFRLYEKGYYNVQCNGAVLYHHESLSRGNDETSEKQVRLQAERRKMYAMHPDLYGADPFYHPYMNTQILDTNFSFAYEYPAGEELDIGEPKFIKGGLKQEWYNDCLLISMEYAADLKAWLEMPDQSGSELYFQGYQFVIGSDNAAFKRSILLQNVDNKEVWEIPCGKVFRPDLHMNVEEGHVSLCGFALVIDKKSLPEGKYQVGCMAKSLVGRQKLCRFVNKFVEV